LGGRYPADEAEPGQSIGVFKNGDSIGGNCCGSERLPLTVAVHRIECRLFDDLLGRRGEHHQISRSKERKNFVVLKVNLRHAAARIEPSDRMVAFRPERTVVVDHWQSAKHVY
jgi:hypothetical protein